MTEKKVTEELLTRWAESCLHMGHLGTLIQRELQPNEKNARALDLARRASERAFALFSELLENGAQKPDGFKE